MPITDATPTNPNGSCENVKRAEPKAKDHDEASNGDTTPSVPHVKVRHGKGHGPVVIIVRR